MACDWRSRDDNDAVAAIGVEHATEQCAQLLAGGAPGIHFYTLNKSGSTREILRRLRAQPAWQKARTELERR